MTEIGKIETNITKIRVDNNIQNYDYDEIKAISSIKMNKFISATSFLFKLQKIISKAKNQRLKSIFSIYTTHQINNLAVEDIRAKKLQNFKFMKKIAKKRPLGKKRSFMKWKAITDVDLQETCVKRFAVCARLNYAVAIYRLRWLVDRDRIMNKYLDGDFFLKAFNEFLKRVEKIKREIYSNRNQVEFGFKQVKKKYELSLRLDEFQERCEKIFNQKRLLREALDELKRKGEAKKFIVEKLGKGLFLKQKSVFERLFSHSADILRKRGELL